MTSVRFPPICAERRAMPFVVDLDDAVARRADIVGAKAAALARARAAGLPALPGFALTTDGAARRRRRERFAGGCHGTPDRLAGHQ